MESQADMQRQTMGRWVRNLFCSAALVAGSLLAGCTPESVRIAIESQRRADDVQQAVFDHQQDGLRLLLFRDLVTRLEEAGGAPLSDAQVEELNRAWNQRDLIEFWTIQFERAKALRIVGVDAKLYSDQSIVDLLARRLAAGFGRVEEGIAAAAGAIAADRAMKNGGDESNSVNDKKGGNGGK